MAIYTSINQEIIQIKISNSDEDRYLLEHVAKLF